MKAVRLKTEYLQDLWALIFRIRGCSGLVRTGSRRAHSRSLQRRTAVRYGTAGRCPPAPCTRIIQTRLLPGSASAGACGSGMRTTIPARGRARPFRNGLLNASDWSALWIAGDYPVRKKQRYPVDCFRKVFSAGQVQKARLYLTACGLYEARLNGRRVGDALLTPGSTDYRKRIQYQSTM